jgi:hypothetical protein
MNIPSVKASLACIVLGAALAHALGEVAQSQLQASGSQQASSPIMHPVAGPNRPGSVPDGYLITPFGYFHPSCVQSLARGERVLTDGRVQHADGTIAERAAVCSYPHYTPAGIPISAESVNTTQAEKNNAEANRLPEFSGWLENANVTTGSSTTSYGALIATWVVPPQPSAKDGQVLFFFPGFEDINDPQTSILQPVLEWSQGWSIASWNCCLSGIVTSSPGVGVTSGDEIYGSITSTCLRGTLSCATWNVLSLDLSTGESTTLSDTPSEGQVFNWAFGGVLEPYSIVACDDYPRGGRLTIDNITLFDQDLHSVSHPKWSATFNSTATPQCHYGVRADDREVTLDF